MQHYERDRCYYDLPKKKYFNPDDLLWKDSTGKLLTPEEKAELAKIKISRRKNKK